MVTYHLLIYGHPVKPMQDLLQKAYAHLVKVDRRMQPLIDRYPCHLFSPERLADKVDPFEGLVSSIISQQISVPAAQSVKARFIKYFNPYTQQKTFPSALQIATASTSHLRSAGLSQRKVEYIQALAKKFVNGDLSTSMLYNVSSSELFEKLITVRGLGKWSIEMFAMFGLKKIDIFSVGDLGIQKGMAIFFKASAPSVKSSQWKYMAKEDMLRLSNQFAPYRSLFMWFMWRVASVENKTVVTSTENR